MGKGGQCCVVLKGNTYRTCRAGECDANLTEGNSQQSGTKPYPQVSNLFSLLTLEFLLYCWQFVNKKAASGVDRINATEYALNLHGNVEQLEASVKGGWYRAKWVLRKYIPNSMDS